MSILLTILLRFREDAIITYLVSFVNRKCYPQVAKQISSLRGIFKFSSGFAQKISDRRKRLTK